MNIKHTMSALVFAAAASSASGLTLEELAARMDKLEKKVSAYEKKYGPLESSAPSNKMSMPRPSAGSKSGYATDADIDAAYLNESNSGGSGGWWEKTSIGGYGEMHLNTGDKDQIDFHRWVLFVNHRFTDKIKFFSEFELEHSLAGGAPDGEDGKPGEVELEQAYVEFDFENGASARVGQFLVPVGILNETHEPDTFFGVERNNVEKNILPATWWEGGFGGTKNFDNGVGVDVAAHSGLQVDPANGNIRSGRQKVASFSDPDVAVTGRVRYNGVPGLQLTGFAQYQNDISAGLGDDDSAILLGASAIYQTGGFGLRALAAHWNISGDQFEDNDTDEQFGYYVEPSYTWALGGDKRVGVFGRYNYYEYAKSNALKEVDEITLGVNFWPTDNVVLKADYTQIDEKGKSGNETFNFGFGYSF